MKPYIEIDAYRCTHEPEKMVLPGIIFVNASHPSLAPENTIASGFTVAVGWWDWAIRLTVLWKNNK